MEPALVLAKVRALERVSGLSLGRASAELKVPPWELMLEISLGRLSGQATAALASKSVGVSPHSPEVSL